MRILPGQGFVCRMKGQLLAVSKCGVRGGGLKRRCYMLGLEAWSRGLDVGVW